MMIIIRKLSINFGEFQNEEIQDHTISQYQSNITQVLKRGNLRNYILNIKLTYFSGNIKSIFRFFSVYYFGIRLQFVQFNAGLCPVCLCFVWVLGSGISALGPLNLPLPRPPPFNDFVVVVCRH